MSTSSQHHLTQQVPHLCIKRELKLQTCKHLAKCIKNLRKASPPSKHLKIFFKILIQFSERSLCTILPDIYD